MMNQLRTDLDGTRSVLILDLKDLDATAEHGLRRDLRKKAIRLRVLKNSLARRVFTELGMEGLSRYLEGSSAVVWGGEGIAELAKEITTQVKNLKKPAIKGAAVDGVVVGAEQVEEITKLPGREALIGRVVGLALAPVQRIVALANAPAAHLLGQLGTMSEGADGEEPPQPAPGEPS
jgi:large subunit ribosomal protein L10